MINIRPHHLLCTQGYSGNGYDKQFVKNMDDIVGKLRYEDDTLVKITFSGDDICSKCPNITCNNICVTDQKVKKIDQKVIKYFGIEQKIYKYWDLVNYIKKNMTAEKMDDICSDCKWYKISNCKNVFCNK